MPNKNCPITINSFNQSKQTSVFLIGYDLEAFLKYFILREIALKKLTLNITFHKFYLKIKLNYWLIQRINHFIRLNRCIEHVYVNQA